MDTGVPDLRDLAEDLGKLVHEPVAVPESLPQLPMQRTLRTQHLDELTRGQVLTGTQVERFLVGLALPQLLRQALGLRLTMGGWPIP